MRSPDDRMDWDPKRMIGQQGNQTPVANTTGNFESASEPVTRARTITTSTGKVVDGIESLTGRAAQRFLTREAELSCRR